ncbi:UNVERIFIED_CONTAM: hypothetical protein FKN15_012439 [Acipenser sinensis]
MTITPPPASVANQRTGLHECQRACSLVDNTCLPLPMSLSLSCRRSGRAMASDGGSCALVSPCAFSPKSHQYLALSTQDGRLRLWDILSNTLYQEYVPSAHLSATCTCLTWGPCRTIKDGPQRKKRKSEVVPHGDQLDLLALGTAAGTVLLYSTVKGQLHSKLSPRLSSLFACKLPDVGALTLKCPDRSAVSSLRCSKWKADKCAVSCLCLSPDGKMLLSAGQTIKMWDLETKEVYRVSTSPHDYYPGCRSSTHPLADPFNSYTSPSISQNNNSVNGLKTVSGGRVAFCGWCICST